MVSSVLEKYEKETAEEVSMYPGMTGGWKEKVSSVSRNGNKKKVIPFLQETMGIMTSTWRMFLAQNWMEPKSSPLRRLNKMIASCLLVSRHLLEESMCHLEGKTLMSRQSPAVWLPCSLLPCFQFFKVFGSFFGQIFTQLYFPEMAEQFCYLVFFSFFWVCTSWIFCFSQILSEALEMPGEVLIGSLSTVSAFVPANSISWLYFTDVLIQSTENGVQYIEKMQHSTSLQFCIITFLFPYDLVSFDRLSRVLL